MLSAFELVVRAGNLYRAISRYPEGKNNKMGTHIASQNHPKKENDIPFVT